MTKTIANAIYEIAQVEGLGAARQSAEYGYVASKEVVCGRTLYFFEDGSTVIFEGSVVIRPREA
ncbi:MAG: hypothetical protein M0Z39_05730 [Actinomycetota bacterium]|nr:hypothetical protein [Actinomycetota bacterium]